MVINLGKSRSRSRDLGSRTTTSTQSTSTTATEVTTASTATRPTRHEHKDIQPNQFDEYWTLLAPAVGSGNAALIYHERDVRLDLYNILKRRLREDLQQHYICNILLSKKNRHLHKFCVSTPQGWKINKD